MRAACTTTSTTTATSCSTSAGATAATAATGATAAAPAPRAGPALPPPQQRRARRRLPLPPPPRAAGGGVDPALMQDLLVGGAITAAIGAALFSGLRREPVPCDLCRGASLPFFDLICRSTVFIVLIAREGPSLMFPFCAQSVCCRGAASPTILRLLPLARSHASQTPNKTGTGGARCFACEGSGNSASASAAASAAASMESMDEGGAGTPRPVSGCFKLGGGQREEGLPHYLFSSLPLARRQSGNRTLPLFALTSLLAILARLSSPTHSQSHKQRRDPIGRSRNPRACRVCGGTGLVLCSRCRGSGYITPPLFAARDGAGAGAGSGAGGAGGAGGSSGGSGGGDSSKQD